MDWWSKFLVKDQMGKEVAYDVPDYPCLILSEVGAAASQRYWAVHGVGTRRELNSFFLIDTPTGCNSHCCAILEKLISAI
jgi:hypothetical protein